MNYSEMERIGLFRKLNSSEIRKVCTCFGAYTRNYAKGKTVVREGDVLKQFGVVLGGQARAFKSDVSGKEFTVSVINEGGYIGLLLAGGSSSCPRCSPVTVTASDRLTVLFLPLNKLLRQCSGNCSAHVKVLGNLIGGISEKAMLLYERIDCLIKPTIREKVSEYLSQQSKLAGGDSFTVAFDREGMADYLNTERSALSRELSKMKNDGLIDYRKSSFKIFW
ncbi:MAG: Crp/Fnr family transcriptional regulator [Oscillospiraceae bacterium]|nr:Crp/Fnr family transcriptional regulator [Oscillospiraceae bacterium]